MAWLFDIRSALLVSAALTLLIGIVLLLVSRTLAPELRPSLRWWIAGTVAHPLGMVLLSLREAISPWISIVLANALIALAFAAYASALRRFFNAPALNGAMASLAATAITVSIVLGIWQPDLQLRLVLLSVVLGLLLLLGAEAVYRNRSQRGAVDHVAGGTLLSGALILFYRAVALTIDPSQTTTVFQVTHVQVLTYAIGSILPVIGTLGILLLCTDRMQRELRRVARIDYLTGAYNRRAIEDLGHRALASARRHGTALTAIVIDLDHFKHINDELGHAAGDRALQEAVVRIQSQLRSEDMLGRLGGEEFLALMPSTDVHEALAATERIRSAVACTPLQLPEGELRLTVSIGVAVLDPVDLHFSHLLQRADRAMYAAKRAGRDRVVADPTSSLQPSDHEAD